MNDSAILSYKFKNLGSFGEQGADIRLTTNSRDPKKELYRLIDGNYVNLITAVMGANASGKTTLLKPIPFLSYFFSDIPSSLTHRILIPYNRATYSNVEFEIKFILDGVSYKYDFKAFEDMLIKESLYYKNENNIYSYIFKREVTDESFDEHVNLLEDDEKSLEDALQVLKYDYVEKSNLFTLGKKEGVRTPCNTSIIASARRLGDSLAVSIATFFMQGAYNVTAWGRLPANYDSIESKLGVLYKDKDLFENVKRTICQWDLGLIDIEIEEHKITNEKGKEDVVYRFYGVHSHKNTQFKLPLYMESAGTQGALARLVDIFMALKNGTYAFIDELGDDLHPNMIKPLLDLFVNKSTNPKGAQIVFSCHKPELINYLGKQRVYICQKEDNESECYRIDEFPSSDARSDDNLAAKYLAGAFGGIPEL